MKRLFLKAFLLLLPFAVILGIIEVRLRQIPNSYAVMKTELDRKQSEVEILVTGASHAMNGVTAEALSRPAFNIANGSQSIHYDTELVMKYADAMPKLKLVVFVISYHSLEYRLSNSIERWRSGFYRQVHGIPGEDQAGGFELTDYSYIALYTPKEAFKRALGSFTGAVVNASGEVVAEKTTIGEVSDDSGRSRVQLHETQMRPGDIASHVSALERACARLEQKKVAVIFITIPAHRTYYQRINQDNYQRMQETTKSLAGKCHTTYLNYFQDQRFADDDFVNSDHLNEKGALKFTKILDEDVIKKYLGR